jgi:phosphatidylglycerol:prolipoprotein diacylglycerol transferase
VQPELDLGPVTLQTFGICFAFGFLGAGALLGRRFVELGKPVDWAYEMIFAGLIGGLIGSRLDYLIQNYDSVSDDLVGALFSGSGLVWFGGLVGGAVGVMLWARWRGFLERRLFDVGAPALALGYAIGRVGCQLSGDGDYGQPTDAPWGMAYPDGTEPTTDEVHPTPVFETVAMGLVALFALYLVLAGVERFLIEFIRRNDGVLAGLTPAQLISLAMVAGGAVWLSRLRGSSAQPRPA